MSPDSGVAAHGVLIEPTTLRIQRVLPGTVERVWAYLTDGELRRKWLAAGDMVLQAGAPFELVWRNDELSAQPSQRPQGFSDEHRMKSRIVAVDPPRHLVFAWGEQGTGEVAFDLEQQGDKVLLTIVHRRVPDRDALLKVSAGWHTHLDTLEAVLSGEYAGPFWPRWLQLRDEYDARHPR
ncbi:SRPBCC family protein [Luteimonas aestuarii]|uniref:SRPBCC family protein n=1 Tax=Luteimonas aestuarii TaxID=453837 RepID=A0A4R5TM50_9GAMM|nr:SRPBCC family protein [Luteimonas aestuarii]TDK23711.1 SRPBCC family protein [Luteimonas aestuarii]